MGSGRMIEQEGGYTCAVKESDRPPPPLSGLPAGTDRKALGLCHALADPWSGGGGGGIQTASYVAENTISLKT